MEVLEVTCVWQDLMGERKFSKLGYLRLTAKVLFRQRLPITPAATASKERGRHTKAIRRAARRMSR